MEVSSMRNSEKYLEIMQKGSAEDKAIFTAGYMAALEVEKVYCPETDDFSSHITQSYVLGAILNSMHADEKMRRLFANVIVDSLSDVKETARADIDFVKEEAAGNSESPDAKTGEHGCNCMCQGDVFGDKCCDGGNCRCHNA